MSTFIPIKVLLVVAVVALLPTAGAQEVASLPASTSAKPVAESTGLPVLKTAREVQQAVNDRYRGEDSKLRLTLVLVNKRGEKRTNKLVRYRKKENGLVKSVLTYFSPRDVKGTATLAVGRNEGDDLQYMYLPALRKLRRIANADRGKSFAGTDWSYEDLREKKLDEYNYSKLTIETVVGHKCYHYSMTPKSRDDSAYGRIEYWVRVDNRERLRGDFYDRKGRLFKKLVIKRLKWVSDASGKRRICSPQHMEMHNIKDKHRSIFLVEKEVYNTGIKDNVFTPRGMNKVKNDF